MKLIIDLKRNLFMLKFIWDIYPSYILMLFLKDILVSCITVLSVYFNRFVVNSLTSGISDFITIISAVLIFYISRYILNQLINALSNIFQSLKYVDLCTKLKQKIHKKLESYKLNAYENPSFHEQLSITAYQIEYRAFSVVNTFSTLISCLFTFLLFGLLYFDIIFLVLSLLSALVYVVYTQKLDLVNKTCYTETNIYDRRLGYIASLFKRQSAVRDLIFADALSFIVGKNSALLDENIALGKKHHKRSFRMSILYIAYNLFASLALIIYLCIKYSKNLLLAGDFFYILEAYSTMSESMKNIVAFKAGISENSIYIEYIQNFLDSEDEYEVGKRRIKLDKTEDMLISLKNVTFTYPSGCCAIDDITLDIKQGEMIAIVGRNGSGKSTLIKLILGLYQATDGNILYNGNDYKEIDPISLHSVFGVAFQDFTCYAVNIAENVLMREPNFDNTDDETLVIEALKFAGIYERIMKLEQGIYTVITKEFDGDGAYLSGGEMQKLVIARAYAHSARLLVLDEPTSSIDPGAEQSIFDNLKNLALDKTIIYISHHMKSTIYADRILCIEDGRIAEQGTHEELISTSKLYKQMYETQIKNHEFEQYEVVS